MLNNTFNKDCKDCKNELLEVCDIRYFLNLINLKYFCF